MTGKWVWLDVPREAELPPSGKEVLVYCPGDASGDYQIASCEQDIDGPEWTVFEGQLPVFNVVARMPLPAPPEVQQ